MSAMKYLPEANPLGMFVPGVPLRDLTAAEFEAASTDNKATILACGFYEPVEPELGEPAQEVVEAGDAPERVDTPPKRRA